MDDGSSGAPAPGWYPDPAGGQAPRWWNGTAWTEHVRTEVAPDALWACDAALRSVHRRVRQTVILTVAVLAVLVGIGAAQRAGDAGDVVAVPASAASAVTVASTIPSAGTLPFAPTTGAGGRSATSVLGARPSAPVPCSPEYDPCVPVSSDVDCVGAPGDGPAWVTGPVRVVGRDVYRLDEDGDGIGCG